MRVKRMAQYGIGGKIAWLMMNVVTCLLSYHCMVFSWNHEKIHMNEFIHSVSIVTIKLQRPWDKQNIDHIFLFQSNAGLSALWQRITIYRVVLLNIKHKYMNIIKKNPEHLQCRPCHHWDCISQFHNDRSFWATCVILYLRIVGNTCPCRAVVELDDLWSANKANKNFTFLPGILIWSSGFARQPSFLYASAYTPVHTIPSNYCMGHNP